MRSHPLKNSPAIPIRTGGTYLITGGLGGLGLRTARWLADRGAGHVVLTSRREPDAATQLAIHRSHPPAARRHVLPADVSDHGEVRRLLADIDRGCLNKGELSIPQRSPMTNCC